MSKRKLITIDIHESGGVLESVNLTLTQLVDLEVATRCRLETSEENDDKGAVRKWQALNRKLNRLRESIGI